MSRAANEMAGAHRDSERAEHDEAALELLRRAVEIESVSGDEAAVAAFLADELQPWCDEAFIDAAGNVVGRFGAGPLAVTVLGHIDTVPGVIPVRIEGDRLYGRGAVDAKGPFCTAVAALRRLPDELRQRLTLRLIGAVEEEAPSSKGARYAVTAYPRPDHLIIGEPSGWEAVTLGYKGRLVVELEARKAMAHSAGAATSASDEVVAACHQLKTWAEQASPADGGAFEQLQLTVLRLASSDDGLEQHATAVLGLRLPVAWPPERVEAALTEMEFPPAVMWRAIGGERAYRGPRDTALTRAFRVAIRQQGGRPRTKVKTGTSDMNVVAPHWPVPMVAYGPGDSALDHRPDEHLRVPDYLRAIRVLETVFRRLAGSSQGSSPDSR